MMSMPTFTREKTRPEEEVQTLNPSGQAAGSTGGISRRKMLTALGLSTAAVMAGGFLQSGGSGGSVHAEVYGPGGSCSAPGTSGIVWLSDFCRLEGETDDTGRLNRAIAHAAENHLQLLVPAGLYEISETITISQRVSILSTGRRIGFNPTFGDPGYAEIRKTNGDAGGDKIIEILPTARGTRLEGLLLVGATAENIIYTATYLTSTAQANNTSYGLYIHAATHEIFVINCGVCQAKVAGFYSAKSVTQEFSYCVAYKNMLGHYMRAHDSFIFTPLYHHNITHGLEVAGNYTRVLNGRFEWNALNGIKCTAGEGQFVGNLFDRNGFAGLALISGWGHVVTGNYFSRNGAGGDGELGRWGFSTPGGQGYYYDPENGSTVIPEEERCHIRLRYQRNVTIAGNRYRSGKDDASGGSNSPAFVYHASNVSTSTASGNAGEHKAAGGHGGCVSDTVEFVTNFSQKSLLLTNALLPVTSQVAASNAGGESAVLTIPIDAVFRGKVVVYGLTQTEQLFSEISVIRDAASGSQMVHVENKGDITAIAVISDTNLVVTFSQPLVAQYSITKYV